MLADAAAPPAPTTGEQHGAAPPAAAANNADVGPHAGLPDLDPYEADHELYLGLPLGSAHAQVLPHGTAAAASPLTAGRRRFLCYFMHRHLEFRLPEIEALAALAEGHGAPSISCSFAGSGDGGVRFLPVVWELPFSNRVRCCCCVGVVNH